MAGFSSQGLQGRQEARLERPETGIGPDTSFTLKLGGPINPGLAGGKGACLPPTEQCQSQTLSVAGKQAGFCDGEENTWWPIGEGKKGGR